MITTSFAAANKFERETWIIKERERWDMER
jgi:hypothetical protein